MNLTPTTFNPVAAPKAEVAPVKGSKAVSGRESKQTDFSTELKNTDKKNDQKSHGELNKNTDQPQTQNKDLKAKSSPQKNEQENQKDTQAKNLESINSVFENKELIREMDTQKGINSDFKAFKTLSERLDHIRQVEQDIVDPLTRRTAIQSFMRKMQKDYDVSPLDLVNSFAQLSVEDLGKAPELTVEKVVANLNIDPQKQMAAVTDFNKMLQRSSAESMADYLKASGRQLSLDVMSRQQIKQQSLQDSIQTMNSNFFAPQQQQQRGDAHSGLILDKQWVQDSASSEELNILKGFKPHSEGNLQSNSNKVTAFAGLAGLVPQGQAGLSSMAQATPQTGDLGVALTPGIGAESQVVGEMDLSSQALRSNNDLIENSFSSGKESLKSIEELVSQLAVTGALTEGSDEAVTQDIQKAQFSGVEKEAVGLAALSKSSEGGEESLGENSENLNFNSLVQNHQQKGGEKINGSPFQVETLKMSEAQEAENINTITNHSQLLAKKGGGEATIRLNPEGMGEVTLKVNVTEGRVNVDLVAENNHTKKLIEKGLGDLKANLAAHKLDVEMIKVDLNNNLADHFKEQQRDAERNFAQQFLQDFRQTNQGFRQGFQYPGDNYFRSQVEDRAANHEAGAPSENYKKKSDRRLDLVA